MDSVRHHKSSPSERFLCVFSPPETLANSATNGSAGIELDEGEVLWTGDDFSDPIPSSSTAKSHPISATFSPPSTSANSRSLRRLSEKSSGILAALAQDGTDLTSPRNPSFLQRKPSISSSSSTSSTPSSSSSARMIPVIPKPKLEYSLSVAAGNIYHQSAPVNVPVAPRNGRRGLQEADVDEEEVDDDEMLPPHEIVERASRKGSPMTTFSVLEGAGRTLKGRDLRQVRNAVWRQTGFLD